MNQYFTSMYPASAFLETSQLPLVCREQILEEVDNIAKANPHIMKVIVQHLHVYAAAKHYMRDVSRGKEHLDMCR